MLKVMIAEDDLMMADMLEDVLVGNGYEVCGIARTVEKGVELAERHKPDLAVLDLRLAEGGIATEIAAQLNRPDGLGILYATGNGTQISLTKADGDAWLGKPYRPEDIVRVLKIVEQIASTGEASKPFPKGFHVLNGSSEEVTVSGTTNARAAGHIKRLHRQQAELASFGSFALGEHDLGEILTEAARVCADCMDVAFCKVCRYRPEEGDFVVEAGVGWKQDVVGRIVSTADESTPQGRAFVTGLPVICGDLDKDPVFLMPSYLLEHGIVSTLSVIIKGDGQPYGVLEIDSPIRHDYDNHDIAFLTGFANVLAEAVDTSKRNAAMLKAMDRMKDMVVERDRMLAAKNVLLDEKNVLAQELQHRVRNNLQLIHGMLSKQIEHTMEGAGLEGFSAITRRVMTLANVYDHLLGTGLTRTIEFGGYLSSLCSSFEALQQTERPNVALTCQWEPVVLDLDTVTPLGLIISELISNSYTHAFPDGTGTISVSLTQNNSADEATLAYSDDGVGFSEAVGSNRRGLGLVKRLMEQVDGLAVVHSEHGTEWTMRFPIPTPPPVIVPIETP